MTAPDGVPLLVHIDGQRVLAVGAGPVAAAKVLPLAAAGAQVDVVAPEAGEAVRAAAAEERLSWTARRYTSGDVDGAVLVVAATADPAVNARVARDAAEQGRLCVRTDAAAQGSASFLASLRRGPVTVAVSTGGRAPALARYLREHLETAVGPEWGTLAELFADLRRDPALGARLAELDPVARRRRWRGLPVADILALVRSGDLAAAREVTAACLSSSSD